MKAKKSLVIRKRNKKTAKKDKCPNCGHELEK